MDAFNVAFFGAFGGTAAAIWLFVAIRHGNSFDSANDVPAGVWLNILAPLVLVGLAALSFL